ncbi:flagellar biosynthesis protein FliQ [Bacillus sp. JJ664]|jgi:flagellar biosynthesis protein FliQ|uniref:Flagellar biosynthetic protein FliQ n=1 Tax=Gottfriedia solisilvae TaxID=1516104 RepID=A0A8J3AIQ9_9BACI|nr:flagellar biosynthesis protein FliQ [Gottfriedia solisilvae]GGI14198.1 flagellar biosynthetic protein FliQ [Gottfriedia solisilvae]
MSQEFVITIAQKAIYTLFIVSGPLLIIALVIGLIVSIFQATTQIQEQTLAFIPKIVAILVALIFFGPWMLTKLVEFTFQIFSNLNNFVG